MKRGGKYGNADQSRKKKGRKDSADGRDEVMPASRLAAETRGTRRPVRWQSEGWETLMDEEKKGDRGVRVQKSETKRTPLSGRVCTNLPPKKKKKNGGEGGGEKEVRIGGGKMGGGGGGARALQEGFNLRRSGAEEKIRDIRDARGKLR